MKYLKIDICYEHLSNDVIEKEQKKSRIHIWQWVIAGIFLVPFVTAFSFSLFLAINFEVQQNSLHLISEFTNKKKTIYKNLLIKRFIIRFNNTRNKISPR